VCAGWQNQGKNWHWISLCLKKNEKKNNNSNHHGNSRACRLTGSSSGSQTLGGILHEVRLVMGHAKEENKPFICVPLISKLRELGFKKRR
jgi:hypothetical protein